MFLQEYRRIGSGGHLRNVRVVEVQLLAALFARMPEACWEVLDRAARCATPAQLSYAYLDAAITRNLREKTARTLTATRPGAAACRPLAPPPSAALPGPAAPDDTAPRVAVLAREDLPVTLLTPELTLDYVEAWIRFVDQNRARIHSRRAYLLRVLPDGRWPERPTGAAPRTRDRQPAGAAVPAAATVPAGTAAPDAGPGGWGGAALWARVLTVLKAQLRPSDYDTWLVGTELVDVTEVAAVVAVPNVFARQTLETEFQPQIAADLGATLKRQVAVTVVIGG